MSLLIKLLGEKGVLENYVLKNVPLEVRRLKGRHFSRIAFSAAHTVFDPYRESSPSLAPVIDWDKTLAYRDYLWDLGLGVAEAMDTAQRGMGLDWKNSLELIKRSVSLAQSRSDRPLIFCGVGTDHVNSFNHSQKMEDVIHAYEKQVESVEECGGRLILMASRMLAFCARSSDDYHEVYNRILSQVKEPVIIHWLGDMFDPQLKSYWGSDDIEKAMQTCLDIIERNKKKIDGIKISLLDEDKEIRMRKKLPDSVKMYTGDDFNYPALIKGDEIFFSHALLGIFDAIAPAASLALQELDFGNTEKYFSILNPTVSLSRHIFESPTKFYKTGIVFLAYLNGHQDHFQMIGGQQSSRCVKHFCTLFKLADEARVLINPELALKRMENFLQVNLGLEQ